MNTIAPTTRTVVITATDLPVQLRPTVETLIATHLETPATRPATCDTSFLYDAQGWHITWRRGHTPGTTSCHHITDAPSSEIDALAEAFDCLRTAAGVRIHVEDAPCWRDSLGLDADSYGYAATATATGGPATDAAVAGARSGR